MDQHLIERDRLINHIVVIIGKRCIQDVIRISEAVIISVIDHKFLSGIFQLLELGGYHLKGMLTVDHVGPSLIRLKDTAKIPKGNAGNVIILDILGKILGIADQEFRRNQIVDILVIAQTCSLTQADRIDLSELADPAAEKRSLRSFLQTVILCWLFLEIGMILSP